MSDSLSGARVLVVEAPYYKDIAEGLFAGAEAVLTREGLLIERLEVPGAFEVPAAISYAAESAAGYHAFLALGCVIRGATTHYDYICQESARALMDLSVGRGLAIGYGILTCETLAQAEERADPARKNKGGEAAEACLRMLSLKRRFGG